MFTFVISHVQIAESLPRICFLSGLSGEEMMMFIDAFEETGIYCVDSKHYQIIYSAFMSSIFDSDMR